MCSIEPSSKTMLTMWTTSHEMQDDLQESSSSRSARGPEARGATPQRLGRRTLNPLPGPPGRHWTISIPRCIRRSVGNRCGSFALSINASDLAPPRWRENTWCSAALPGEGAWSRGTQIPRGPHRFSRRSSGSMRRAQARAVTDASGNGLSTIPAAAGWGSCTCSARDGRVGHRLPVGHR
jgi:hypothetical protein